VPVNRPGDRYQGKSLKGIKEFVKIAGISNLEKYLQETKKGEILVQGSFLKVDL